MGFSGWDIKVTNSPNRYPGNGFYYVICSVCGRKFRRKECVLVKNKWSLQNGALVCKNDLDRDNEQLRPIKLREELAVKVTRPPPGVNQVSAISANIAPSAPQFLQCTGDTLNNYINLWWMGPNDCGSSDITGYNIYQAQPQLGVNVLIATINNNNAYTDNISVFNSFYTYQVSALNLAGESPLSNIAFWPYVNVNLSVKYLTMGGAVLSMGGQYLTMGPQ